MNLACRAVDPGNPLPKPQRDVLLCIKFFRPKMQPLRFHFAEQILLRQGRTLVGQMGLFADQGQRAVISFSSQGFDERRTGLPGTDHNNSCHRQNPWKL